MRVLSEAPPVLAEAGEVRFGSFRGGLPRMDFGPVPQGRLWQLLHKKQWTYALVADERVLAAAAVVSLGWAATAMVFVLDRRRKKLLVDKSVLGPGTVARFDDAGTGTREARFALGRSRLEVGDRGVSVDLTTDSDLPTHLLVRPLERGPAPIAAVVPIDGGFANATEKRLVPAEGEIVAGGERFVLKDAFCAFDHTAGFLARHTAWRWALGLGRTTDGEPVGFNVVEGFVGEAECGVWLGDVLHPVGEGRFSYDPARPDRPWRVTTTCGALDLSFAPSAVHGEKKDLVVVRSQFVQPLGAFEGRLRLGEREVRVADLAGVTEHQDVVW